MVSDTSNVHIEIDPDRASARARSYVTVFQATDALRLQPIHAGRYLDEFARHEAAWFFAERRAVAHLWEDQSGHASAAGHGDER
jgi:hypothetical protein